MSLYILPVRRHRKLPSVNYNFLSLIISSSLFFAGLSLLFLWSKYTLLIIVRIRLDLNKIVWATEETSWWYIYAIFYSYSQFVQIFHVKYRVKVSFKQMSSYRFLLWCLFKIFSEINHFLLSSCYRTIHWKTSWSTFNWQTITVWLLTMTKITIKKS